ncbi:MAG: hypothetical protein JJU02_04900 [Cryomorphaceae bacterium]|nr:hypothetical protein [Cryomorphaceae bacterium]
MIRYFLFLAFGLFFNDVARAQDPPPPRVLNDEFHKVILQVINVIPHSDRHAIVFVKDLKRKGDLAKFTPLEGEFFMTSFFYTTNPTRSQEKFKDLGFDLPGVKPGDIISCQLLGDPSQSDSSKVNWRIYEYVVIGHEPLPNSVD